MMEPCTPQSHTPELALSHLGSLLTQPLRNVYRTRAKVSSSQGSAIELELLLRILPEGLDFLWRRIQEIQYLVKCTFEYD